MSRELELVSAILEAGSLSLLREHGITPDKLEHAGGAEAANVLRAMLAYAEDPKHAGRAPNRAWVQRKFPNTELPETEQDLIDLIEQVDSRARQNRLNRILVAANKLATTSGIQDCIQYIAAETGKLLQDGSSREDLIFEAAAEDLILGEYDRILNSDGLPGIPFPWPVLNDNTQGMCPGDFIVFYGLTKAMKTWLVLAIIEHLTRVTDAKMLVYIKEMPKLEVVQRLALLRARVNDKRYSKGQLEPEEYERLRDTLSDVKKKFSEDPRKGQIVLAGAEDHLTPSELKSRIRKWGVQGFFADSLYLMADDRSKSRSTAWGSVGNVSGDLRDITISENVFGITTSQEHERTGRQLGRKGTASIGYAHKIIEDATIGCHIFKFIDKTTGKPELGLTFPAVRKYDIPDFTINAVPAEDFTFKKMGIRDPNEETGGGAQSKGDFDMSGWSGPGGNVDSASLSMAWGFKNEVGQG